MDRHHARNTIEVGQILDAGFVIFQPGNEIDMHK